MLFAGTDTLEDSVLSAYGVNVGGFTSGYSKQRGVFVSGDTGVTQPDVILLNSKYSIDDLRAD